MLTQTLTLVPKSINEILMLALANRTLPLKERLTLGPIALFPIMPITESNTEPIAEASLVNALENNAGIDLLKELKGHYQEDPIFQSVLDKPKEFRNFKVKDGLVYLKLNGTNLLCIFKMMING